MDVENALEDPLGPAAAGVTDEPADVVTTAPAEPSTHRDEPVGAAARLLEVAATTADRLVADARTEAGSLVAAAQAEVDALLRTRRDQAQQVAAELDRERATALAGLAEEKAACEAQIGALRQMHSSHRDEMRRHLTQQLTLLDAVVLEPPRIGA
jgi:cell division septum initiation protein DivIVA